MAVLSVKFVTQDYYEILNVSPGATNEEVKRAYRLVRQSFRPDSMAIHSLYAPEETEAISAKIDEAFRILSDAELARRYAKYHRSARPGATVPRDPDVFFDLVHDLDGPSPIEQLARQVGRLSEERRQEDRVVEEPVTASVRSLPPQPRYNPAPASTREMPAITTSHPEVVLGDAVEVAPAPMPEPDPFVANIPTEPEVAPVEEPAAAMVDVWDSWDADDDIEDISVVAIIEEDEDDDADDLESLPSSAFHSAAEPPMLHSASEPPAGPTTAPPMRRITRPVPAPSHDLPLLRPSAGPAPRPPAAAPVAPSRPRAVPSERSAEPMRPAARSGRAEPQAQQVELPSFAAATSTRPQDPSLVALPGADVTEPAPVTPSPAPRPEPQHVAAAPARVLPGGRRRNRESIRTRAVGPLDVQALDRATLEAMEMDCGGMNGAFLKAARRELGVSVKDISERTKISVMMLRYIEADDVEELPAKVYLKGYLTQVARLLKLPVQGFVGGYMKVNGIP